MESGGGAKRVCVCVCVCVCVWWGESAVSVEMVCISAAGFSWWFRCCVWRRRGNGLLQDLKKSTVNHPQQLKLTVVLIVSCLLPPCPEGQKESSSVAMGLRAIDTQTEVPRGELGMPLILPSWLLLCLSQRQGKES